MQSKYRLKSRKSFTYIYKHGAHVANDYLTIVYVNSNYATKIGFSVSKKIGNSVTRNKVRRRLKESCRLHIRSFDKNTNYIIIPKPEIINLLFEDYWINIDFLLKTINKKQLSKKR